MNIKKLKIAFLGGGISSAIGRTHRIAIDMDKKYELVSGCFSRDKKINLETANEYDIDTNRVYSNLNELINNEKSKIDAICILTPTPNHKNEVIKCIENNIPVICEKALASTSKDILKIKEALIKHNGFLAITYNYTGYPMLRELKAMVKNGTLGKLQQIHIEMPQEGFAKVDKNNQPIKPQNWRLSDNELPTISLDLGTHTLDLISFLSEEKPIELVSLQNSFGSFKNIIDNSISIINYTNDIVSNIWYSKTALGQRNGLKVRIYGSKGSAKWYQLEPENLYFYDNKGQKNIIDRDSFNVHIASKPRYNRFKAGHPSGFIEAFANYYDDIASYLLKEKSKDNDMFNMGVDNALEGLYALEAMTESNKYKKWIKVKC